MARLTGPLGLTRIYRAVTPTTPGRPRFTSRPRAGRPSLVTSPGPRQALELDSKRVMNPPLANGIGVRSPPKEWRTLNLLGVLMLRSTNLTLYNDISYRSPGSTSNGLGSLGAKVEVARYGLTAAEDRIGPSLALAQEAVTLAVAESVRAVEEGPLGAEVKRLQAHLDEALATMVDLASKTHELQRRRSEVIRGDGKGPAIKQANDRLHVSRADHSKAGEFVAEVTSLLEAAESRLKSAVQTAKVEALTELSKKTTADLERAEREAANAIVTALGPVFVASEVLRAIVRRGNAARTPKAAPADPINVPTVTNRQPVRIERTLDYDDLDLGIPGPVEVLS